MGLFDDDDLELDALLDAVKKYPSCVAELNEGNVQAIFNRCRTALRNDNDIVTSNPFPIALGYSDRRKYHALDFDKETLLKNKACIKYLLGQLHPAHIQKSNLTIEDFFVTYSGEKWTSDKEMVLKLVYLGGCIEVELIFPFNAKKGGITRLVSSIKPTLSPKDPAFPAWWEAHKGEWEA